MDWSPIQGNEVIQFVGAVLACIGLVAIAMQIVTFFRKKSIFTPQPAQPDPAASNPPGHQSNELNFQQFFHQNPSAMLLIEPQNGSVLDANPPAEVFYGYTRDQLLDTTIYDIAQVSPDEIDQAGQKALDHQCCWFTFPHLLANGDLCMVETHLSPVLLDGKLALALILHDVTARVQEEAALRANEAYYHALVEASPDAVMLASQNGTIIACNPQSAVLFGYNGEDEMMGLNLFSLFPPEGRGVIREKVLQLLRDSREKSFECTMLRANGSTFQGELSVSIILDPNGRVDKVIGISRDITRRKQMEAAIKENEMRYRIVADNTYDWEFWQTPDQELIYSSPSCQRVTGYDAEAFLNDPGLLNRIIYEEDRAEFARRQRAIREKRQPAECEFRIVDPHGEVRWIGQVVQPVFDDQGFYMGLRGSNRDITQRKLIEASLHASEAQLRITNEQLSRQVTEIEQLHQELREQALRDPLTGLYNRRYLSETLPRELSRATRENQSLSFIMMDIDHFKAINDSYGHQLGDVFIQKIAHQIRSNTRGSDIACRYGGEEFLLVMLGANEAAAQNRAEEIRLKCAAIEILFKEQPLHITLSLGISTYPVHGLNEETLLHKADLALYLSKGSGRNRVTVWRDDP